MIYVRISSDREGRELGVQRQEEDCRLLADRLGLSPGEVYRDNDVGASRLSRKPRPAYARMLADARDGRVGTVLAWSTSRLTRRPREFEDWIDLADDGCVRISTVKAGDVDLSTAAGRFYARMLAARDAAEAEEASERARRERQQRREHGRWHGGPRPFGWDADGKTPRPDEQALVVRAYEDILAGRSLAAIARDWNGAGVGTPQAGRHWHGTTVRDVLLNPRHMGELPGGYRATEWEPVVDEATWRGARAVLMDPARAPGRGPVRLLTGIALCGMDGCDATVYGGVGRGGRRTYRCSRTGHMERVSTPVDELVTAVTLRRIARGYARPAPAAGSGADLGHQAEALRARLAEAGDLYARGEIPAATMTRITASVEAQLSDVERRMAASVAHSALAGLPLDEDRLRELWAGWDIDRQRAVLKATGIRVRVKSPGRGVARFDPATVPISWPRSVDGAGR